MCQFGSTNDRPGKRYPKVNANRERLYRPKKGDTLLEFPLDYPASAYLPQGQNAKGHAEMSNGPARDPGIARAIINHRGAIQGVNYHPKGDMARHVRASEIRNGKVRRF
jgi:hypothetical protein